MSRSTGRYLLTSNVGGEKVRSFLPRSLPPSPPLSISTALQELLYEAHAAIGRLDSVSVLLPETGLFLYMYVRKEAVLSSQIEGTQSSLSDLLAYEAEGAPGAPVNDVQEVSRYVAAMDHGLARIREGFPLSNRLIREIHQTLLTTGRGSEKAPGEFRTSPVWIGGSRPGNAEFVPPPASHVAECMSDLERWLHGYPERTPTLIKAALAHVQFETIHPFLDGNGRVGRLLVTLLLCAEGLLKQPMLYLSLYLKQHRARYYELLMRVRSDGAWEEWLEFFARGAIETAASAVATATRLTQQARNDRVRMEALGRLAGNALRVHATLLERPVASAQSITDRSGLSVPTANRMLRELVSLGLVREITGRRRGRLFSYDPYLRIMSEDTEPL
ncbi:MAG: Fic family protein [Gemmatimonas sp.]